MHGSIRRSLRVTAQPGRHVAAASPPSLNLLASMCCRPFSVSSPRESGRSIVRADLEAEAAAKLPAAQTPGALQPRLPVRQVATPCSHTGPTPKPKMSPFLYFGTTTTQCAPGFQDRLRNRPCRGIAIHFTDHHAERLLLKPLSSGAHGLHTLSCAAAGRVLCGKLATRTHNSNNLFHLINFPFRSASQESGRTSSHSLRPDRLHLWSDGRVSGWGCTLKKNGGYEQCPFPAVHNPTSPRSVQALQGLSHPRKARQDYRGRCRHVDLWATSGK